MTTTDYLNQLDEKKKRMSAQLPPEGRHAPVNITAQVSVYLTESENPALCVAIPLKFGTEDWAWSGKHTMTLIKQDGTPMTNNIDTLKEIFGWDGEDPFWLMWEDPEAQTTPRDLTQIPFSITGEHKEYTPSAGGEPRMGFQIKWLNPLNRTGMKIPQAADRSKVLAMFGKTFRSLATAPAAAPTKAAAEKPAEKPKAAAPEKKAAPSTPPAPAKRTAPAGMAPTATMQEAWEAFVKANPGTAEKDMEAAWFKLLQTDMFPGVDLADLTIQQWGQVKASLSK